MDRRSVKPSVRRCLFGRPTNSDDFKQVQKKREIEEERRFKREWNLDGVENGIQWTEADMDTITEFYTRGYSHKPCKRRPVRPCVGKSLSFADSDNEDEYKDGSVRASSPSPVQYCGSSTVEVFIGRFPQQSPQQEVTPKKSDGEFDTLTLTSESDSDAAAVVSMSRFAAKKELQQTRLTDVWRVLKRRHPSLVSSTQLHKRARIDRV